MPSISPEFAAHSKAQNYTGKDLDLYTDLGFFNAWFAMAELSLTALLALASKAPDLAIFDVLCKGMDARVKVERFRKLVAPAGGGGPNLKSRLKTFEEKAIPLRNKLAHSAITINEDDGPRTYYLSSLSNLPWAELGERPPFPVSGKPEAIMSNDLHSWGLWLAHVAKDFGAAFNHAASTGVFEIVSPVTPEQSKRRHQKEER
jgi:hypothetical protein